MSAVSFALLGAGLLIVPAPQPVKRRLGWLATARWDADAPVRGGRDRRLGVGWWRQALLRGWILALVLGVPAGLAGGTLPAALAALTGGVLARCWHRLATERESERATADLSGALAALLDEYAAGATVGAAFAAAATGAGRFRLPIAAAAAEAGRGGEVAAALRAAPALVPLGVGCATVGRTGASLAAVLAGVQADLAADQRSHRAVQAALAGPRSSAVLLSVLPIVGIAMGAAMGADPARVLLHTTIGLLALTAGVLLDLTGLARTLALARRAVR